MQVGGLGGAAASWLNSLGKIGGEAGPDPFAPAQAGQNDQAKPAASNTGFPTRSPVALGADGLMALQEADEARPPEPSAADRFLELMKKSPEERLRDSLLKSLGLTQEDLQSMSADERKVVEDMIAKLIKERITPVEGETNLNSLSPDQVVSRLKAGNQRLATDLTA